MILERASGKAGSASVSPFELVGLHAAINRAGSLRKECAMPPDQATQRDRVFLLRIWEERSDLPPYVTYRLSLEEGSMRARKGFADLERLITFLESVIAEMRARSGRCVGE
jgi:hypothetical protein